jgi:3-dehydroquinate dehydratase
MKLGGFMTYAAPDEHRETAPGQIPVSIMHDMLARLNHAD